MASGTTELTQNQDASRESALLALARVLASHSFRGAVRIQQLLRHIVLHTLDGDLAALKETRIAIDVFERGESFDSAADSIVRTQASLLRKRLADYYASAGPTETLRIELPRGAYIAHFVPIEVAATPAIVAEPTPRLPWVFLLVGLALGIMLTVLIYRLQNPPPATASLPIWSTFMRPVQMTTLALGSPYFTDAGNGIYLRDVTVNTGEEMEVRAKQADSPLSRFQFRKPSHLYTGVGEAIGLERITRVFEKNNWPLRVVRADLLRWQEMKDENVIFLGSSRFRSVAGELDPHAHFAYDPTPLSGRLINLHPRPGEPKEFVISGDAQRGETFALVTILPGKSHDRQVLFLQGLNTWGTQAAAEFIVSPEHLAGLQRKFPVPRYVQVLIRAELRNEQPMSINIVTTRDFTPAN